MDHVNNNPYQLLKKDPTNYQKENKGIETIKGSEVQQQVN